VESFECLAGFLRCRIAVASPVPRPMWAKINRELQERMRPPRRWRMRKPSSSTQAGELFDDDELDEHGD
jgi:hypothetical protein